MEYNQKITAEQLKRKAVLYIRQSTMRQVYENTESTLRQYALKEKLIQLGWLPDNIIVIDCDLGQSGSGLSEREGFRKLVSDVGNNEVGAVACLESSRLARNSQDWGRLLEICTITKTVLIDADGIYNLSDFNDRMLLGLKGTMSEAELHLIRARLRGGALNKAKRGEYRSLLPTGYVYDGAGNIIKDPGMDVQSAITLFFESFRICGSAAKTVLYYRKNGYKMPVNPSRGFDGNQEISWVNLNTNRALEILHNPIYAGIYAYGRRQSVPTICGTKIRLKPREEWHAYIKEHHESYISEIDFEINKIKLLENSTGKSPVPPVREGKSLLQGICICGVCGKRMTVQHNGPRGGLVPYYVCADEYKHRGGEYCQRVHGVAIDKSISDLVLERLTPVAISNAIKIQKEIEQRRADSGNYFVLKLEKTRYEAELARKRYMSVDPSNRLVAFELEKLWNTKINELAKAEEELRVHENKQANSSDIASISELMSIPDNVRELWNSGRISMQDKKRMLRCLVEDVTIIKKSDTVHLGVCFKGGTSGEITCANPPMVYDVYRTPGNVVEFIRSVAISHTMAEIVRLLAERGYLSGHGKAISYGILYDIMCVYDIPTLKEHLKSNGFLTAAEKAAQINVPKNALYRMKNAGILDCKCVKTSGKGDYMYEP